MEAGQIANIAHDVTEAAWAASVLDKATGKITFTGLGQALGFADQVNKILIAKGVNESAEVQQIISTLETIIPFVAKL